MNNFHYVAVLLDMLYGLEMEDQDLEEYGLIAWGLIGNKNVRLYKTRIKIDPKDNSATLPCNAFGGDGNVELVTSNWEDWSSTTNYSDYGDESTSFVETLIEVEKQTQSPWYLPGKILKYHQVDNKLYFTHNYGVVNVLYKGYLADEEGLPQLTDKEATAIATYIAWVLKFKEGLATNNPNTINLSHTLKHLWAQQCDQARITYINQNDMEQILEISNSWDRKSYGKSKKLIK